MWAPTTGIEMKMWTNMEGLQIYSCDGLNGTIAVKASQQRRSSSNGGSGNGTTSVPKYGCVVLEAQDVSFFLFSFLPFPRRLLPLPTRRALSVSDNLQWIDGINHPEWGREQFQIFSPTTGPAVNYQRYEFSAHD
jgi:aldose 1-epimerase